MWTDDDGDNDANKEAENQNESQDDKADKDESKDDIMILKGDIMIRVIIVGSVLDIAPAVEGSVTITAPFKRSIKRHILFKVIRMIS